MQAAAGGTNALMAIGSAVPASGTQGSSAADSTDENGAGQTFSQLLSDSGNPQDQSALQQYVQAQLTQPVHNGLLSAQEVAASPADALAKLLAAQQQIVTPAQATHVLAQLDKIAAQETDPTQLQALSEIKQQLVAIQQGGDSKTVAQILAAAPTAQDANVTALTELLAQKKLPEMAVENTADASAEAAANPTTNEEEVSAASPLVQASALVFHADDATAEKQAAQEKDEKSKKDDGSDNSLAAANITVVIAPLAATSTVAVPAADAISVKDTMGAGPASAIKPREDLDAVVPPLNSADDDDALPAVSLPKMAADDAASAKDANAGDVAGTVGADTKAASDKSDPSALNNLLNPSQTGGASATQTMHAVQPVSVIQTPGLTNHAPITEQVQVALKQADKDGIEHITIQLDPAGLGRVEVHMHKDTDGQTQISFTVDKADTFDSLSRDARTLERSLQESGIKADTGSMQFNLRQQPQPQAELQSGMQGGQQQAQQQADADEDNTTTKTSAIASIAAAASMQRNYLFNVREGVDISA